MRRRPGVVPYNGPEAEHVERRKEILADARFIMKFLKYRNLNGFDVIVFVRDKTYKRLDMVVRKGEEPFWGSKI